MGGVWAGRLPGLRTDWRQARGVRHGGLGTGDADWEAGKSLHEGQGRGVGGRGGHGGVVGEVRNLR